MWILFSLLLWLLPVPSFAVTFDLSAAGEVGQVHASTPELTSWSTGNRGVNYFVSPLGALPVRYPAVRPFASDLLTWAVTPTQTRLTTSTGVTLLEGVTASYQLSVGTILFATFTDAVIDSRWIGGITSNAWTGSLTADTQRTSLPRGDWSLTARTATGSLTAETAPGSLTAVPEPATLALVGPAVAGLWLWRRTVGHRATRRL